MFAVSISDSRSARGVHCCRPGSQPYGLEIERWSAGRNVDGGREMGPASASGSAREGCGVLWKIRFIRFLCTALFLVVSAMAGPARASIANLRRNTEVNSSVRADEVDSVSSRNSKNSVSLETLEARLFLAAQHGLEPRATTMALRLERASGRSIESTRPSISIGAADRRRRGFRPINSALVGLARSFHSSVRPIRFPLAPTRACGCG